MKTFNYSKQRQAIMDFLCSRTDHPTAEVIYQNVKAQLPNISLGTVYRNLNQLADNGRIRRIKGANDAEHFDGNTSAHQHFICTICGAVDDIFLTDLQLLDALDQAACKAYDGSISCNDIYFYGSCRKCSDSLAPGQPSL